MRSKRAAYLGGAGFGVTVPPAPFLVERPAEAWGEGVIAILMEGADCLIQGCTPGLHHQLLLHGRVVGARLLVAVLTGDVGLLQGAGQAQARGLL